MVGDLESRQSYSLKRKRFPAQARRILLLTASLHILEGKGITVGDLENLGLKKDNAEKKIFDGKKDGLLIPGEVKNGGQKQYYLSNYKYIIDEKAKKRVKKEILPNDVSLLLAQELSGMKYAYHNIHLETFFNNKKDYDLICWPITSERNRQKVKKFKLEPRRNCIFTISSNGTVGISIESTCQPYEFHTASGIMEFIVSCGQILMLLQTLTKNNFNIIPRVNDWHLMQFDYNKDIPVKYLQNKYPTSVVNWSSKGVLKLEYLGTIFQIYCKEMPYTGECLRCEGDYSTKEKKKVAQMVRDIAGADGEGKKHPFTTAEEMLLRDRERKDINDDFKSTGSTS